MAMTMGQIIKELRKAHGFTQEELAERLGVTIRRYQSGRMIGECPTFRRSCPWLRYLT